MLSDSAQLLLIILSTVLIIFLVVAIVVAYKLIQVIKSVKRITDRAEHMAQNMEDTAAFFKRTAGQLSLIRLISNIADAVTGNSKNKKGK